MMLKKITFFVFSLYISLVIAEPKISDYKKYPKTNSNINYKNLMFLLNTLGVLPQLIMKK